MTPQGQAGVPAQQPGWFSRNWKWVVGLGCALPLLCCGVFSIGTYFTVTRVIQGTPVFAEAVAKANQNPEVTAALGSPVTPGFMLQGSVNESGGGGSAEFTIPLEGPKGKGSMQVRASKKGGQWTFDSLTADVGGKTVDLLAGDAPMPKLPPGGGPPMDDGPADNAPPTDDAPPADDLPPGEPPSED
ncbi:MAG: cytochrome c oxidase assembly factor Coa1 family protein [Myxococcota bacterium]|jgi:hypothetical protein